MNTISMDAPLLIPRFRTSRSRFVLPGSSRISLRCSHPICSQRPRLPYTTCDYLARRRIIALRHRPRRLLLSQFAITPSSPSLCVKFTTLDRHELSSPLTTPRPPRLPTPLARSLTASNSTTIFIPPNEWASCVSEVLSRTTRVRGRMPTLKSS
jgi:hypothetical protein